MLFYVRDDAVPATWTDPAVADAVTETEAGADDPEAVFEPSADEPGGASLDAHDNSDDGAIAPERNSNYPMMYF